MAEPTLSVTTNLVILLDLPTFIALNERSASMSTFTFSPQILGQTEKAVNALLDRQLDGTGLTEPLWITLTVTAAARAPLNATS